MLSETERDELGHHLSAWLFSQFLHGEQGALTVAARIVESVPDMDSKFYAATQAMDEARHVELYSRFMREKIGLYYPVNPDLAKLLADALSDSRWDMPYLGMQVLIEGLALAAFGVHRDIANNAAGHPAARLRHAGRGPARRVRPAGAARLLRRADRGRAGRPRGIRRRGLLPDAQPVPRPGGLGADGLRRATSAWSSPSTPRSSRRSARCCSAGSCRASRTSGCGARRSGTPTPTWASSTRPTATWKR